ncbi:MAG: 4Fe-4S dicluster domain-containing protein [Pseudomonadota bacterium]|nr:4Fe-4S dicluster domain-containing protein [Pseudomonadota bacterium]
MERFITLENLIRLAEELTANHRVLAPVVTGGIVTFRRFQPGMTIDLSRMAAVSPKAATFPQTETLLTVRREHEDQKPELQEVLPQGQNVVIGCRPCGARGKLVFDPVYETDKIKDPYYLQRRNNTVFLTLTCDRPETTCFCHSVGGGPADPAGSDVLLTLVEGGYVARSVTPRGEDILKAAVFEDAGDRGKAADEKQAAARALMGEAHDYTTAPARLLARFDDMDFWRAQSDKCISCGACTYMCPTCYCFNITDDDLGLASRRIRTWDNCMSHTFTLEGSGHNPRSTKAHRLKNRVGHKFSYYPDLHKGFIACCGCGRCIKQCPSGVDIRQIVKDAQEYSE